jgi:hypothetical protein
MRFYTVTYESSGTYISDWNVIEYSIDTLTVNWSESNPYPSGCGMTLYLSLDNGTTWMTASNGQLHEFGTSGKDLKYKLSFWSDGHYTSVFNWLEVGRSIIDYGINPSLVLGDDGMTYLAYQPVSVNNALSKNITLAKANDTGYVWSMQSFSGTSVNEDSIPKILRNASTLYLFWYKEGECIYSKPSHDNGTTWLNTTRVSNAVDRVDGPEDFSVATYFSHVYCAYVKSVGGSPEIFTNGTLDTGGPLDWSPGAVQTLADAGYPSLSVNTVNQVYLTMKMLVSGSENVYFRVLEKDGITAITDAIQVSSSAAGITTAVQSMDSLDNLHVSWVEGSGTGGVLKYWNNTPTNATTMASTVNNYISYLPVSAFTNASVASGQKVALMTTLQNNAQAIVGGLGELASNRLTYQDITKIVSQGGSQVWVTSSYVGNVWTGASNLKTNAGTGGIKPLSQPVIVVPGPLLADWNTDFLTKAYVWLQEAGLGTWTSSSGHKIHNLLQGPDSELYGSLDRSYWSDSSGDKAWNNKLLFDNTIGMFRQKPLSDDPPPGNMGVNPYPNTITSCEALYALAWFYTHRVQWIDRNNNVYDSGDLFGQTFVLDHIIDALSYLDRCKESNLYWVMINHWIDNTLSSK